MQLQVNDKQLKEYIGELANVNVKIFATALGTITHLTTYAEEKMKSNIKPVTRRTTGRLKNSINIKIKATRNVVRGRASVGEDVAYQYAAELGFSNPNRKDINPGKAMAFPPGAWRNPKVLTRLSSQGNYIFYVVKRGRYPGMHYARKAYEATADYIKRIEGKLASKFGKIFLGLKGFR